MGNDAIYNGDAAATSGSLSFTSPILTWTGDLAPGAAAVITYTVTVNNPDTGDKLVINTVSSTAVWFHLPARLHHPGVPGHRPGAHPGADYYQDRQQRPRPRRAPPSATPSRSPTPARPSTAGPRSPTR